MSKRYTCEVPKEVLSLAAHDHPTATAEHRQQMYRSIAETCDSFNRTEICLGNELVNLLIVLVDF
jgi:hypothetical protein